MTLRMVLWQPKIVFVAQLDHPAPQEEFPLQRLKYKNLTVGSEAVLRNGMTILLGTAPGKDEYGRLRFKRMDDPVDWPQLMVVSMFSKGTGDGEAMTVNNCYITVLEEYRIWAKIPMMYGANIYKDGEWEPFPNARHGPPVANAGTGYAGTIDGTGKLKVGFAMGNSFKWSLAAGIAGGYVDHVNSFLWEAPTGVFVDGTNATTSQTVYIEFPPGFHHVYLTVWGDNYGSGDPNPHTCSVPVFVRDPNNDLSTTSFIIRSHQQNFVGMEITAEFFEDIPKSVFPDGGLMMMWDDSITNPDTLLRLQMCFIGWHFNDNASIEASDLATLHSTHLTFYNVGRKLETLPGFSMVLEYNATPVSWSQTNIPTMFYYFWFILFWYSTALEVCDLRIESEELLYYEFVVLGSDRSNLHEQINSISQKVTPDHFFTSSRHSIMQIVSDPMVMSIAERIENKFVVETFSDADWTSIQYTYQRPPRVHQLRTIALISTHNYIIVDGNQEVEVIACVAPGQSVGQGEELLENTERVTINQAQLNDCEGHRYARINARYGRFSITIPYERLSPSYDLSHMEYVALTITDSNLPEREATAGFVNQKGMIHEMTIQYEYTEYGLVRFVTFQWEMETFGPPAQTRPPEEFG